jgi:hypothetical protein
MRRASSSGQRLCPGGYLFGDALQLFLGDVKAYDKETLATIVALGLLAWSVHSL